MNRLPSAAAGIDRANTAGTPRPDAPAAQAGQAGAAGSAQQTSKAPSREDIRAIILSNLPPEVLHEGNVVLFGAGGALDSLGLVNLLADIEYRLAEVTEQEVVLASERAMSQSRSPFRDVESLTSHILATLSESRA